jgi:predicted ATPase
LLGSISALLPSARAEVAVQFIAELAGVPFSDAVVTPQLRAARGDHQLMVDYLLATWLEWLEALNRTSPLIFCVEDMDWSDPASVRLIEAALRSSRGHALMVLGRASRGAVRRPCVPRLARCNRGLRRNLHAMTRTSLIGATRLLVAFSCS